MQNSHRCGKALTFAMRHRTLRAACVLCPEEVLNNVIEEENYISCNGSSNSLNAASKCCFGAFLAMEIEAMGLALPHSDLVQLSTMHFSSYALALWRHHGRTECHGYKGHFMLLLLELSMREGQVTASSLITSIIAGIAQLDLPRTMLLACECIATVDELESVLRADDELIGKSVSALTRNLAKRVLSEFSKVSIDQLDKFQCLRFLKRFGKVIASFSDCGFGCSDLPNFIDSLLKLVTKYTKNDKSEFSKGILELAISTISHLKEPGLRLKAFSDISAIDGGSQILKARFVVKDDLNELESEVPSTSGLNCSILVSKLEQKLNHENMRGVVFKDEDEKFDEKEHAV